MKRAFALLFTAILAVAICSAGGKKTSGGKPELVPAPVKPDNAPPFQAHPNPLNFPGVQYPRIEADSRVTFRFVAPAAQKVQVSIVNVPFDMVKGADGPWTYTSGPQAPGYHNYWMIVVVWIRGPMRSSATATCATASKFRSLGWTFTPSKTCRTAMC